MNCLTAAVDDGALARAHVEVGEQARPWIARTKDEPALWHKRSAHAANDALGQVLAEIQQHIAEEDQINPGGPVRRRRIALFGQVQLCKTDQLADLGADPPAWSLGDKVGRLERGVCFAERPLAVQAFSGTGEIGPIQICRDQADLPIVHVGQHRPHGDRQRIGLFTGGATRAPQTQSFRRAPPRDDLGQDLALEHVEVRAVAVEVRLTDRQRLDQLLKWSAI